jgi:hypothetical protein
MRYFRLLVLVAAVFSLSCSVAPANTLALTFTNGGVTFTFDLPASPTPSEFTTGDGFEIDDVTSIGSFGTQIIDVVFYNASGSVSDGGFGWMTFGFSEILSGPQVFEGMDSAPTLLPGKYALTLQGEMPTLNIADVPESGTFLLVGTGAVSALRFVRRRKNFINFELLRSVARTPLRSRRFSKAKISCEVHALCRRY